MFLKKNTNKLRSLFSVFAVLALAVTVLVFGANNSTTSAGAKADDKTEDSPAATFAGTNTGPIADSPATGTYGPPRVISFAVTGVTANVTTVSVNMTLTHTWVGDLDVVLASPGGTRSLVIFSRVGATTETGLGYSSNLAGTYSFSDSATANFWTAANVASAVNIPPGAYRTTAPGGAGQTAPAPVTSLNATFGGLTPAQANGTWTLTFRDRAVGDVGNVTAANLTVEPTGPVGVIRGTLFDFSGEGRTDFTTLVFNTNANIIWNIVVNPANPLPNQGIIRR
ncbi:MAG: proprotein convertase P-domain-containing protein, partial [Acidobacteriota bacterium]|nr:proprotein convertase P-domain-containing protein [Acidobacteriota bacterium]